MYENGLQELRKYTANLWGLHKDIDAALLLTQSMGNSINKCSGLFKERNIGRYRELPVRFSIGAICFKREFWQEIGYFNVEHEGATGAEETQVCGYCLNEFKPCVCALDCMVIHLGYYTAKEVCKEYFLEHPQYFDNTIGAEL